VVSRSEHQQGELLPKEEKPSRKTKLSFLKDIVEISAGGHGGSEESNELDIHLRVSYKTLVFLCVTFAVSQRAVDAIF